MTPSHLRLYSVVVNSESSPVVALHKAVELAGSQSALARITGVSQQAVFKWLRNRRHLPAEHVLTVERETGISRHDLRPDLYPRDPAPIAAAALEPAR